MCSIVQRHVCQRKIKEINETKYGGALFLSIKNEERGIQRNKLYVFIYT